MMLIFRIFVVVLLVVIFVILFVVMSVLVDIIFYVSIIDVRFGYEIIDGVKIVYWEVGDLVNLMVLFLYGFLILLYMFCNLILLLVEDYYVIVLDYQGFGVFDMLLVDSYDYMFDIFVVMVEMFFQCKVIDFYVFYLMDYGVFVGYWIFVNVLENVIGFIIQNGNVYEEGLKEFWDLFWVYWVDLLEENVVLLWVFFGFDGMKWQFIYGMCNLDVISFDNYWYVQYLLDWFGNQDVQLEFFYDYV